MPRTRPRAHTTFASQVAAGAIRQHGSRHSAEWRCSGCGRLLGIEQNDRMHISFSRGHEYLAGFPVTATCRACSKLNHRGEPA